MLPTQRSTETFSSLVVCGIRMFTCNTPKTRPRAAPAQSISAERAEADLREAIQSELSCPVAPSEPAVLAGGCKSDSCECKAVVPNAEATV